MELRTDPVRAHALGDLVRSGISIPRFRPGDGSVVQRIEELLASGRVHLHQKPRIVHNGAPLDDSGPPFPLAQRQSRSASPAPAVSDPPSFPPDADLAAQAAALVAAASSGVPFCEA